MTFPTGTVISTANVDSPDDDPNLARVDIYNLIVAFNQLVDSVNEASGVAVLNASGKIGNSQMPSTIAVTGNVTLQPSTGIVSIQSVARLAQLYTADLGSAVGTTAPSAGDLAYLVDGDAGQPCLGCYDGTAWRVVRFMTQVGDVGSDLTAESTLTATAD